MNGIMILSKPDLLHGFRNARDRHNVGIHEFAHLVDKADGVIDGVPAVGLEREAMTGASKQAPLKKKEMSPPR